MHAILCATLSSPVVADTVTCDLSGAALQFAIDRTQFAPAVSAGEPPRRRTTTVTMEGDAFEAEPFMIAGTLGFWQQGSDRTLIVAADGSASFSDPQTDSSLTGRCKVVQ